MKLELELKHLAPYVVYNLKVQVLREDESLEIVTLNTAQLHLFSQGYHFEFKPILRSISDLSKEIQIDNKKIIPIVELLKTKHSKYYNKHINDAYGEIEMSENSAWFKYMATFSIKILFNTDAMYDYPEYWIMEKLFEWHYDVFGLIKNGAAIDINTINQ